MNLIRLENILKKGQCVEFHFHCSDGLKKYFTHYPFQIEFPENIANVPDAVCAIPFVCNVLPIVWLTDSTLEIPELDLDFYESIPEFKKGYGKMFPGASFRGTLRVGTLVDCRPENSTKPVMFYSGGLDATTTLFRHLDESPELLTIWGADIDFENQKGWNILQSRLKMAADFYHLPLTIIHSSFRKFDNEGTLSADFINILHDGWWHGVKHGIAIISHAAIYAWLHRNDKIYIASTYCYLDSGYTCASDPSIDDNVRFFGCQVIHDGFDLSRQDKAQYVADFQKEHNLNTIPLHVCWESQTGKNCSYCEKCLRTIVALIIAGADPRTMGFEISDVTWKKLRNLVVGGQITDANTILWKVSQANLIKKWDVVKKTPYGKKLNWLRSYDFDHPKYSFYKCLTCIRNRFSKVKHNLAIKCPWLYAMYRKLK